MVATKVSEVFSKGYEWASGGSTTTASAAAAAAVDPGTPKRSGASSSQAAPLPATPHTANNTTSDSLLSSPMALWDAASSSLSTAADQAYSSLAGVANSAWESSEDDLQDGRDGGGGAHHHHPHPNRETLHPRDGTGGEDPPSWLQSVVANRDSFGSPWKLHNPYNRVRGRYAQNNHNSSLSAVRSLLPLVRDNTTNHHGDQQQLYHDKDYRKEPPFSSLLGGEDPTLVESHEAADTFGSLDAEDTELLEQDGAAFTSSPAAAAGAKRRLSCPYTPDPLNLSDHHPLAANNNNNNHPTNNRPSRMHQNSETASQLAEGTVRALRDIALDEAVEFHAALRYWSDRWEHPMLSWLEAGPTGTFLLFVCLVACCA